MRHNPGVGRPRVIVGAKETQLLALLDAGVTQAVAAKALDVSLRSVSRWCAEERATTPADPFWAIVDDTASLDELLRTLGEPPRRRRSAVRRHRRSNREWMEAARRLAVLDPERWGPPSSSDGWSGG
jgi:hypothetical protein